MISHLNLLFFKESTEYLLYFLLWFCLSQSVTIKIVTFFCFLHEKVLYFFTCFLLFSGCEPIREYDNCTAASIARWLMQFSEVFWKVCDARCNFKPWDCFHWSERVIQAMGGTHYITSVFLNRCDATHNCAVEFF